MAWHFPKGTGDLLRLAPKVITACNILHNIGEEAGDQDNVEEEVDPEDGGHLADEHREMPGTRL